DHRLVVIGTFDDVQRRPDMLRAVLVPATTMARLPTGPPDDGQHTCGVIVATRAGAAAQVAGQLPFALRPDAPNSLAVIGPPDPATFRRSVERPVRLLALALSIAALAMGAASIASTMSAGVAARVGEIGLRKALGARSIDIAAQITGESLLVGLTASLVGALVGCYGVIGVALAHNWQPILSLPAVGVACAAGAAIGAVSGLVPAIRAARMAASEALRR
ncbi:MAG TPA: ABC transporter permease, partial [Jatrophihabitantaceae bacterium]|nr:ABC transporter permease [Jatrophihabitantaceae bacterium]